MQLACKIEFGFRQPMDPCCKFNFIPRKIDHNVDMTFFALTLGWGEACGAKGEDRLVGFPMGLVHEPHWGEGDGDYPWKQAPCKPHKIPLLGRGLREDRTFPRLFPN